MAAPTVCLAFDSVDVRTLRSGIEHGWLPNVGALLDDGAVRLLEHDQRLITTPSWPTLVTGVEADDHGLFCDRQLEHGSYTIAPARADDSRTPPFWAHAGAAGRRTTVVGVYGAAHVPGLPGTQLLGWGTHDPFRTKLDGVLSDPPSALEAVTRAVGERSISYGLRVPRTAQEFRTYIDRCLVGVRQQTEGLLHLLRDTRWDLFVGGWAESHEAGHFLWHLHDPDHPRHDPSAPEELRSGLRRIYEAIDEGIGRIRRELGEDVAMLLFSPYGLGPDPHGDLLLPPVLEAAGLLSRTTASAPPDRRMRVLSAGRRAVHVLVPARFRPALGRLVPRERWVDSLLYADVDWGRTGVFPLPTDGAGALRFNLAGREPSGIVEPGQGRDRLFEELSGLLFDLVALDDGEPVVDRVVDLAERWGDIGGPLPDVAVEFRARYPVARVTSPRTGEVVVPLEDDDRTGLHDAPGLLLGAGPGIPREPLPDWRSTARLTDVGPTVLDLAGVPRSPLPGSALFRSP